MAKENILKSDFIFVCAAQFTISFVIFILIPTIPIYLLSFHAKEAEIGVLVGSLSVSSLVLRPFVGRALLKIPERKFMMAGALFYVIASLAYLWAPPFWPLLAVRILQGMGLAFFATASFTLVANIVPESHRGQMISYFYLANNLAFALAPYFGILIVNQFGFNVVFLVCTALSLVSLYISVKLKRVQSLPPENQSIGSQPFLSREALPPATMALLVNVIWGGLTAFFPLYAVGHGINPGLFFAVFALMLILCRSLGGKIFDLYDRNKLLPPCLIAYVIGMTLLAFSKTLPLFILVAIIWGIGNAFLYPSLMIYALERAGATSRGPAMGTFTAVADLGTGIGPMVMGLILQLTNYPVMFLCLALTGVTNFLYFHFFLKKKGADQNAHLRISL